MQQRDWLLESGRHNNRGTISLKAGLSAEICLAKYIAFKRNAVFIGYHKGAPKAQPDFIKQTLGFLLKQYTSYKKVGSTALFAPGICSVPYICETGDILYLPSQFLVAVDSMSELQLCLYTANSQGYKCYGVIGYDCFIPDKLCVWIKFAQPPQQYLQILKHHKIQNLILMSVHDKQGKEHGGERFARLVSGYSEDLKSHCQPQAGQIYAIFVNQSYGKSKQKDIDIFSGIVKDREKQYWNEVATRHLVPYIHDWQSGIDCICNIGQFFQSLKLKKFYITHSDSWNLYLCSYYLGRQFIFHNYAENCHKVTAQGVVFNQYFMNNPTYELNYGWIPIMYWQWYPRNPERILKLLTQEEKALPRWFNMHPKTQNALMLSDSLKIITNHEGKQLGDWITKYAPKEYKLKYLSMEQIYKCLNVHGLIDTSICGKVKHSNYTSLGT